MINKGQILNLFIYFDWLFDRVLWKEKVEKRFVSSLGRIYTVHILPKIGEVRRSTWEKEKKKQDQQLLKLKLVIHKVTLEQTNKKSLFLVIYGIQLLGKKFQLPKTLPTFSGVVSYFI